MKVKTLYDYLEKELMDYREPCFGQNIPIPSPTDKVASVFNTGYNACKTDYDKMLKNKKYEFECNNNALNDLEQIKIFGLDIEQIILLKYFYVKITNDKSLKNIDWHLARKGEK